MHKYVPTDPPRIRHYILWNSYLDHDNIINKLNLLINKQDEFYQIYKSDLKWFNNAILNEHTDILEDGAVIRYGKPIRPIDILRYKL